jgi:hypothetical protein
MGGGLEPFLVVQWLVWEIGMNQLSCHSSGDFSVLKAFYQPTLILCWLKPPLKDHQWNQSINTNYSTLENQEELFM